MPPDIFTIELKCVYDKSKGIGSHLAKAQTDVGTKQKETVDVQANRKCVASNINSGGTKWKYGPQLLSRNWEEKKGNEVAKT